MFFRSINLTTFFYDILILTIFCFQIASSLGLNALIAPNIRNLHVSALSGGVALYLFRFYRLMSSGQRLLIKVKQSKRALENYILGLKSTSILFLDHSFISKPYMLF